MEKDKFIKAMVERKPERCSVCHGRLRYIGGGQYECFDCGHQEIDDFGKVKQFVDEHGPSPAIVISECTGVPVDLINGMLKEGRLEIPDGSSVYIKCEKCGCSIRYGRYCPECLKQRTNSLMGIYFNPDVGERPSNNPVQQTGRMHFLGLDDGK